ncbi:MAG: hypothetical protein GXO75_13875 [Calditrichaeota bacterium]|nr:hypothetical protein [Calditrichota bacterium]
MREKSPSIEDWKKLYKSMMELKNIAPWEWLEEDDLFAVQNPETKEIGFVSVMGAIGEHYAISVYLGEKGLNAFWDLQHSKPDMFSYQKFLEMPQLQASFEDRNFLIAEDRNLIKKSGLVFRGSQSWPMFRSYRPGFVPWFLNSDEAHFLQFALDQTIDVSLRAKKDRSLLMPGGDEDYLLRKAIKNDKEFVWQDSVLKVSPPTPQKIEFSINMLTLESLKNLVPADFSLEIDVFMLPEPVKGKETGPYYPYVLMMVDAKTGMIVGNQMLEPLPTLESMWETIPSQVDELLKNLQLLPERIFVNSDLLYQLLLHLSDELNVSVKVLKELPNITQARASLLGFIKE